MFNDKITVFYLIHYKVYTVLKTKKKINIFVSLFVPANLWNDQFWWNFYWQMLYEAFILNIEINSILAIGITVNFNAGEDTGDS